ncbi:MAG: hypothetical protein ACLQVY_30905 [Limisphaerales bacterium]
MKDPKQNHAEKNSPDCYFPACKAPPRLLETVSETERNPFQGGAFLKSPACSSLDQFQVSLQAGEMLFERLFATQHPIDCGIRTLKPQDAGRLGIEKMRIRDISTKAAIFGKTLLFASWFLRENHGASKTNRSPH